MAKIEDQYPGALDAYLAGARPVAIGESLNSILLTHREVAQGGGDGQSLVRGPISTPADPNATGHGRARSCCADPAATGRSSTGSFAGRGAGSFRRLDEKVATRDRDETEGKGLVRALSADELVEVLKFQSDNGRDPLRRRDRCRRPRRSARPDSQTARRDKALRREHEAEHYAVSMPESIRRSSSRAPCQARRLRVRRRRT